MSGMLARKTIKIWSSFFELQSIMSGMIFDMFCSFRRLFRVFCFPQVVRTRTMGEVGTFDGHCVWNIHTKNF